MFAAQTRGQVYYVLGVMELKAMAVRESGSGLRA